VTTTLGYRETGSCWVCGASGLQRFHAAILEYSAWHAQDPGLAAYTGEKVWLVRCSGCGFAQPERIPTLPRYFERMYDQRWSEDFVVEEFTSTYRDVIYARILAALGDRVPRTPRTLLDIGSHVGRFLHLARQAGWESEGTEINDRTATYATAHSGSPVHRVRAEQVREIGRVYDAVTLSDVLEHIPEPVTLLSTVRQVLGGKGWISVKVPCGPTQVLKETWHERLGRGYRATLADNLVHVNHFSPRALRLALERAGYTDITVEIAAPEYPPGSRGATWTRMAIYNIARVLPFGVHTPLALHLQAFARATDRS
jgi:SAM-dependent methyltransferase